MKQHIAHKTENKIWQVCFTHPDLNKTAYFKAESAQ